MDRGQSFLFGANRSRVGLVALAAIAGAAVAMWRQGNGFRPFDGPPAAAAFPAGQPAADEIVDVLPRDRIPAVFDPEFVPASRARIANGAHVIGYAHGGEAHAYAINLLNGHEIVNDLVGGQKIAATW